MNNEYVMSPTDTVYMTHCPILSRHYQSRVKEILRAETRKWLDVVGVFVCVFMSLFVCCWLVTV